MFLNKVEITNFRVYYGKNILDFGRSNKDRNVYIIGGLTGYGKTSLLTAITLGLLGKNATHLAFDEKTASNFNIDSQYRELLQKNFSKTALAKGEQQMSVKLIFDDKGTELHVERKWWLDDQGVLQDEELNVFQNGAPLEIAKGVDPQELKEEFIETKIPPQVAKFFFFDGEEIRKIAEKDPSGAVVSGLNSLLGFAMLQRLEEDLEKTKRDIKTETGNSPTKTDLLKAETELSEKEEELGKITEDLEERARDREKIMQQFKNVKAEISAMLGGDEPETQNKIQEQLEELDVEDRNIASEIGKFCGDLLFLSMPKTLFKRLNKQLTGELTRKEWEGKKNLLSPQKVKIIEGLFGQSSPQPEPPLIPQQKDFLINRLDKEWNNMFNPPPEGMADNIIHKDFSEDDTRDVIRKLEEIKKQTQQQLHSRILRRNEIDRRTNELKEKRRRMTTGPEFQELLGKRDEINTKIGRLDTEIEGLERRIPPIQNEISSLKKRCTDLENEVISTEQGHKLIDTCKRLYETVDEFMRELRNKRVTGLSQKMTGMYKTLAHKEDLVNTISINPTSYKVIMKGKDGNELPDGSAGESEIFALSMIYGLAEISRRNLPFIIDTPFGRLDSPHRDNIVSRYFPKISHQVIIFSSDTELNEKWYRAIEPYVAKSFLLEFDKQTKTTTISENRYFKFE